MESLLSAWPKISEQIQKAKHILLLTDFDGTLAPIAERPELAALPKDTRGLLQALTSKRKFTIGIISGRSLADLKSKVKIDGVIYAGNHGFEIEGPGLRFVNPIADEIKPFFEIIRRILELTSAKIKGVFVEDKGITLSVHYRQADENKARDVKKIVEQAVNGPSSQGLFKMSLGKKVYEVRPAVNWNKGKAVKLLIKKYGQSVWYNGLFPIYLGDDLTDEDAFRTIEKFGRGMSVFVGECYANSSARYYLRSPDEVYYFLLQLVYNAQKVSDTNNISHYNNRFAPLSHLQ
jgi:trehalose 6-phosphate phosphatase